MRIAKNKLGADMVIKPGGGAIELKLGYNWELDRYGRRNQHGC